MPWRWMSRTSAHRMRLRAKVARVMFGDGTAGLMLRGSHLRRQALHDAVGPFDGNRQANEPFDGSQIGHFFGVTEANSGSAGSGAGGAAYAMHVRLRLICQ